MDTKTAIHPLTGRLMPRSNGRPKGSKNKRTLLREQLEAKAAGVVSGIKVTPLEVLLRLMNEADAEYTEAKKRLDAAERPRLPVDAEGKKALRELRNKAKAARKVAFQCAVAAAPYYHAKLKSVDKAVKKGLIIQIKQYKLPDAPARNDLSQEVRPHRAAAQLPTSTTSAAAAVDES